ncbi:MAG: hypothetical protein JST30_17130 [Armatimonadetes bacterium]|nr:hypothetical protein [Armatimonadota bacterium]
MYCFSRGTVSAVALLALAAPSHAYVLIDDFTQGTFDKTYLDDFTNDFHERLGLDQDHVAFGERQVRFEIGGNLDHHPVRLKIGDGAAKVTTDTHGVSTRWDMVWGNSDLVTIDFSHEKEFWIDLYTKDPPNRLADIWSLYVRDSHGVAGNNPGWLFRQGGIRFRKQDFNPLIDWSSIEYFDFDQTYSTDVGPHPLEYSVTKIYAVPEPGGFIWFLAAGMCARRKKHVQQASQRPFDPSLVEHDGWPDQG